MSKNNPKNLPSSLTHLNADDKLLVAFTQELIRIKSVTPLDPKDLKVAQDSLDLVEKFVKQTGATTKRMSFSGGHDKWDYEVDNLYIEWTIGNPEKFLCYMGHTDVVPPGDTDKWDNDPFKGQIKDGYIYGRGATDMKGSITAFLSAVKELTEKAKSNDVNMRIGIILTTDEEWAAVNGSQKVLEWMKSQGKEPDAFIVGEPSSQDELGTHIKIGRRGSLCGTFNIQGIQGHAAYSDLFDNPNRALSLALTVMNSQIWKDGNKYFPNTNFEAVALNSGNFKASAVIPGQAEVLWNFRFTHNQTPQSLDSHVQKSLKNPPKWAKEHPDFETLKNITITSNIDTASTPYYNDPKTLASAAIDAIKTIKKIDTKIDGSGGTTDARFIQNYFKDAQIIEMGLPERGGICSHKEPPDDYLKKGGMHQIDERASVQDILKLRDIFKQTVINYSHSNMNKVPKNDQHRKPRLSKPK
ncbi:MAG: succinyl-diaminopimelate desuccinylase [Gammaproteobacteria bacterium]|nr:succinyl-diaminopimelate desuccinylase [Gammaproteobacteria bacterium]